MVQKKEISSKVTRIQNLKDICVAEGGRGDCWSVLHETQLLKCTKWTSRPIIKLKCINVFFCTNKVWIPNLESYSLYLRSLFTFLCTAGCLIRTANSTTEVIHRRQMYIITFRIHNMILLYLQKHNMRILNRSNIRDYPIFYQPFSKIGPDRVDDGGLL